MNEINEHIDENELGFLLKKAKSPEADVDFTQKIMKEIYKVEIPDLAVKRYLRFSWVFILLASALSIKVILIIEKTSSIFSKWTNQYIPGLSYYIGYMILVIIAGILLFELNLVLSHYFKQDKGPNVVGF